MGDILAESIPHRRSPLRRRESPVLKPVKVVYMATIEERQRSLVSQFDAEIVYLLDGVAAKMDTAGLGQSLQHFRKGKEPTRPPAVTLEPTRTGLMLGLVISRPANGRMVYDKVLGRWDFTVPIRPRGPLDATNAMHRRAAYWACDMAERLLGYARQVQAGTAPELVHICAGTGADVRCDWPNGGRT